MASPPSGQATGPLSKAATPTPHAPGEDEAIARAKKEGKPVDPPAPPPKHKKMVELGDE
jgi:hypothetical protein